MNGLRLWRDGVLLSLGCCTQKAINAVLRTTFIAFRVFNHTDLESVLDTFAGSRMTGSLAYFGLKAVGYTELSGVISNHNERIRGCEWGYEHVPG